MTLGKCQLESLKSSDVRREYEMLCQKISEVSPKRFDGIYMNRNHSKISFVTLKNRYFLYSVNIESRFDYNFYDIW